MKKENKIKIDFHGNRDFYNLIKGVAIYFSKLEYDLDNNEKINIIINYIERNFGGIEYEIDINYKLKPDDIEHDIRKIESILEYNESYIKNKPCKISSVFLFKGIYNMVCNDYESNFPLKIENIEFNNYNINKCINDNIRDFNSRFLLLEISPSQMGLISQIIKLQNPFKEIIVYNGSPFLDDINNSRYSSNIINEINNNAKEDKLIIIENFDQIHPFLFELYNKNYQIIDGEKYTKIFLDNFNPQLIRVSEEFRIIVFIDKKCINKYDLMFLDRFEKIDCVLEDLLNNELKRISRNIIKEINLKSYFDKYKKKNKDNPFGDLLINCEEEDIHGLIYYFSQISKNNNNDSEHENHIDEDELKEKVINKIYKILPYDIISILPDENIIKQKYLKEKKIFNIQDYINEVENKQYKISIIYTFSIISNIIENFNSFWISEIKNENGFKNKIEELKILNEKEDSIFIYFEHSQSKYLNFISNYILNNYKDDKYNYIIIIHINKNCYNKTERIYSLPDINPYINQIFIDDLNGQNKNIYSDNSDDYDSEKS